MLTIIVNLESQPENGTFSLMPELEKGVAFIDHPKLVFLKQEMLFSGTTVKPRQRQVTATEYSLEVETNPSLEKRIMQALTYVPPKSENKLSEAINF